MATPTRPGLVLSDAVQLTALPHGGYVLVPERTLAGIELTEAAAVLLTSAEASRPPVSAETEEFLAHALDQGWLVDGPADPSGDGTAR